MLWLDKDDNTCFLKFSANNSCHTFWFYWSSTVISCTYIPEAPRVKGCLLGALTLWIVGWSSVTSSYMHLSPLPYIVAHRFALYAVTLSSFPISVSAIMILNLRLHLWWRRYMAQSSIPWRENPVWFDGTALLRRPQGENSLLECQNCCRIDYIELPIAGTVAELPWQNRRPSSLFRNFIF